MCIRDRMGPGEFTSNGHFIVLTGLQNGRLKINDPNSRKNSEKTWDWRGVHPPPGSDDKAQSRKVHTSDEISAIPYTPKPAGFPYSFCFFL